MINHLYTLLLNRFSEEAAETVDPRFAPVIGTTAQQLFRQSVISESWPVDYQSVFAASMERLVYGSQLSSLLEQIDVRSTIRHSAISPSLLEPKVEVLPIRGDQEVAAEMDYPIIATGRWSPSPSMGIWRAAWDIAFDPDNAVRIHSSITGETVIHYFDSVIRSGVWYADISNLPLGNGLYFSAINLKTSEQTEVHCKVRAYSPPSIDLAATLVKLRSDSRLLPVFDAVGYGIDGDELRSIFLGNDVPFIALPAALVAFAASFDSSACLTRSAGGISN